jgi:hypothetical protein
VTDNLSESQRAAIEAAFRRELEQWLAGANDMFTTIHKQSTGENVKSVSVKSGRLQNLQIIA